MAHPRILHLVDPAAPGSGPCMVRLLAVTMNGLPDHEHHLLMMGTRADVGILRRCGVSPVGRISVPGPWLGASRRALWRSMRAQEEQVGRYHVVHAWSERAGLLAASAARRGSTLVTTAVAPVGRWQSHLVNRAVRTGRMDVSVIGPAQARAWSNVIDAMGPGDSVRPGVRTTAPEARGDRFGRDISDAPLVIALISDPPRLADARRAAAVLTRLAVTGRRAVLLVHPQAARLADARRWMRHIGDAARMAQMITDAEVGDPGHVTRAVDVALHLPVQHLAPSGTSLLPVLEAMAAGIPVVTAADDNLADLPTGEGLQRLKGPNDVDAAASLLMRLYDDSHRLQQCGAAARASVAESCSPSEWCHRLAARYERIAAT